MQFFTKEMNVIVSLNLVVFVGLSSIVECQVSTDPSSGDSLAESTKRSNIKNCRTSEMTDEDVEAFIHRDREPTHGSKCIETCVLKKLGIITEDGKFDVEATIALYKKMPQNEDELSSRIEIIKKCADVAAEDECELPGEVEKCLIEHGKETGYNDW